MIRLKLLAYFLAFLLIAALASFVAHDRKVQERELAPVDAIRTSETLLSPPPPRRHEWRRRDRA